MKHFVYVLHYERELTSVLEDSALAEAAFRSSSILIQVFLPKADILWAKRISSLFRASFPNCIVVGATTVGEIAGNQALTGTSVLSISCFFTSQLSTQLLEVSIGTEYEQGKVLGQMLRGQVDTLKGILLFSTPLSIDCNKLLKGMEAGARYLPIFGGGAGDYLGLKSTLIFLNEITTHAGVVAICLYGDNLSIEPRQYLGWIPLGANMKVTGVDGLTVRTINNQPAFDAYTHYLGIRRGEDFLLNVLAFPFLIERNGLLIARIPMEVTEEGYLNFIADVDEGETVHLGCGDMGMISREIENAAKGMAAFCPEGIYIYSCANRHMLLQDDINSEIEPFGYIAPTAGFFTYGEFFTIGGGYPLLNCALVAVGIKEGQHNGGIAAADFIEDHRESNSRKNRHWHLLEKLTYFSSRVARDLEIANQELEELANKDALTGVFNRRVFTSRLTEEVERSTRYPGEVFSVIMFDIDHFKRVNDNFGHIVGDGVLKTVAGVVAGQTRAVDTVARYGGEEFILLLPHTSFKEAEIFAERLRRAIEISELKAGENLLPKITASFGVASYSEDGTTPDALLSTVDAALYRAKESGRNCVMGRWGK
ncbi:MAG: diguanylate cyclase [Smithellaceae bacterium]